MDKAKILRLCNEIEDEVTDIAFDSTHKHIYDCCESIREYLKEIATEITAPSKSNGDRIRKMTDEELCDFMAESICDSVDICMNDTPCRQCRLAWLKQEASTNKQEG